KEFKEQPLFIGLRSVIRGPILRIGYFRRLSDGLGDCGFAIRVGFNLGYGFAANDESNSVNVFANTVAHLKVRAVTSRFRAIHSYRVALAIGGLRRDSPNTVLEGNSAYCGYL